jgi:hypothetical protein
LRIANSQPAVKSIFKLRECSEIPWWEEGAGK